MRAIFEADLELHVPKGPALARGLLQWKVVCRDKLPVDEHLEMRGSVPYGPLSRPALATQSQLTPCLGVALDALAAGIPTDPDADWRDFHQGIELGTQYGRPRQRLGRDALLAVELGSPRPTKGRGSGGFFGSESRRCGHWSV